MHTCTRYHYEVCEEIKENGVNLLAGATLVRVNVKQCTKQVKNVIGRRRENVFKVASDKMLELYVIR